MVNFVIVKNSQYGGRKEGRKKSWHATFATKINKTPLTKTSTQWKKIKLQV